jgi:catechol 2,3-dioxygenase-like lactoylglutathione lyase family enzyme
MGGNTLQITPFMHVADLDAAVRFFVDTLGFAVRFRHSNYAYVEREGAAVRILASDCPEELGVPHRGFAYYIDVRDLDQVVRELGPNLAGLPAADVHGPVDQAYGQRELMVRAPDGNLVVFGQAMERND